MQKSDYYINDEKVDADTYYSYFERNWPETKIICSPLEGGYPCTESNLEQHIR